MGGIGVGVCLDWIKGVQSGSSILSAASTVITTIASDVSNSHDIGRVSPQFFITDSLPVF
jgi:hypothetical protein